MRKVWLNCISNLSITALTAMTMALPAVADDSFTKGTQAYTAKNYAQAEQYLSATVKQYPNFWQGHYYLGHTFLALGRHAEARKEYEACMGCQPAPGQDILDACRKTITALGGTAPAAAAASTDGQAAPSDTKADDAKGGADDGKGEGETAQARQKRQTIERLRNECQIKVNGIREELKQAIIAGDASSSKRYYSADTDSIVSHMSPEDRAVVEKDFQDRINRVQQDYERRIKDLR